LPRRFLDGGRVCLHEALDKTGVFNRLVAIPGGQHGMFSQTEMAKAYEEIRSFLDEQQLNRKRSTD
jgi:hypothetical protein